MKYYIKIFLVILFCSALVGSNALAVGKFRKVTKPKLEKRIKKITQYFEMLMEDENATIPSVILGKAQGIIILRQYKFGLGIGIKGGGGVAMARDSDTQEWSPVSFINAGEGSWGLQVGGQKMDVVMLLMNEEGMHMLSQPKFRAGVDVAAVAGPHDIEKEAKYTIEEPVLVYMMAEGAYAGAAFEGGFLVPDDVANAVYYDDESITMQEIVLKKKVKHSEVSKELAALIDTYSKK